MPGAVLEFYMGARRPLVLGDRQEGGDCGPLTCFARILQSITKEMGDTISIQRAKWSDGARKGALGVYLMSQFRGGYLLSIWFSLCSSFREGRFYPVAMAG